MLAVQGLTVSNDSQSMRESMSTTTFSSSLQQPPTMLAPQTTKHESKMEIKSNAYTIATPLSVSSIPEIQTIQTTPVAISAPKIRSINSILKAGKKSLRDYQFFIIYLTNFYFYRYNVRN